MIARALRALRGGAGDVASRIVSQPNDTLLASSRALQLTLEANAHSQKPDATATDKARAFELWSDAARLGDANAAYSAALCLRQGIGAVRNARLAADLLRPLADARSHAWATFAYADMLDRGGTWHR
jgi:TPR repeat protein